VRTQGVGKIKCLIIHGAAGHGRPFRLWIYWQTASSLPDLEEEEEEEEEMTQKGGILGEMFGAGRGAHCARPPSAAGGRRSLCFAQRLRGIRRQDASGGEMFGARRRAHRAQDDTSADSENLRPADAGVCASRQPDASRVFLSELSQAQVDR
jgi:hypothetical protein